MQWHQGKWTPVTHSEKCYHGAGGFAMAMARLDSVLHLMLETDLNWATDHVANRGGLKIAG